MKRTIKTLLLCALIPLQVYAGWDPRPVATADQWAAVLSIQPGQKKGFGGLFKTNSDDVAFKNHAGGVIENYVKKYKPTGLYSIAVKPEKYTNNPIQVFYTPVANKAEAAKLCGLMGAHLLHMDSYNAPGVIRHIVAPLTESKPFYPHMTAYAIDVWRPLNINSMLTHNLYNGETVFSYNVNWSADNFTTGTWDPDVESSGYYVVNPNNGVYDGLEFTHYIKEVNSGYLFGDTTQQYYGTGNIPTSPICEWRYQDIYQIW